MPRKRQMYRQTVRDLAGMQYLATEGKYKGQLITVIGQDAFLWAPEDDYWKVQAPNGDRWSVKGWRLRQVKRSLVIVEPKA